MNKIKLQNNSGKDLEVLGQLWVFGDWKEVDQEFGEAVLAHPDFGPEKFKVLGEESAPVEEEQPAEEESEGSEESEEGSEEQPQEGE